MGKTRQTGKLDRINAREPDCILYDFGNIRVQSTMIEKLLRHRPRGGVVERQTILIVESEIGPFVLELQRMLGRAGAKTLVARDVPTALLRNREFEFTAAAVNAEHEALTSAMDIPTLVYGPTRPRGLPRHCGSGVSSVECESGTRQPTLVVRPRTIDTAPKCFVRHERQKTA
jgi:hypothetical protein